MFRKILIANRGEIAVRVIRACRDLGIISVAVYSQADEQALHAQIADEAICIGPAAPKDSYLNMSAVISAALLSKADAIHPGFGFLSENAQFARLCRENNIVFIGPEPDSMDLLADKALAKKIMRDAGIPVIPGSDGAVGGLEQAERLASEIGYPVMLKAAAGGGGKGIRLVWNSPELSKAYSTAQAEAVASFGDGSLYIEKYIASPRHIEFQIIADGLGNIVHLFERDCSIQRRHQKLIEEGPSPALSPALRAEMGEKAVEAARAVNYKNAGTIEFLLDKDGAYYFMEMNTRIQVEHPVTECITGIDLVALQIKIAAGEPVGFTQEEVKLSGHAIECRINAEDPSRDFAPCPGTINALHIPGGIGVRVDGSVYQGYTVPPYYDSMLAKLIVHGKDRAQAISRMRRALAEFLFDGITINGDFHLAILSDKDFVNGDYRVDFLETHDIIVNSGLWTVTEDR